MKRSTGEREAIAAFIHANEDMSANELVEKINGGAIKNLSGDVNAGYVNYLRYQKQDGGVRRRRRRNRRSGAAGLRGRS